MINYIISKCRKLGQKEYKTWLGGEYYPLRIVQEIEIWPYYQMVYAETRISSGKCEAQNSLGFWDTNRSPNAGQKTRSSNKKKRIFIIKGYCLYLCYFHNVSANISSGLLQVFVELGNLHGTSNYVLYRIHGGRLFWFC